MLFPAKSSGVVWIIRRRALRAKRYQELRGTVLYLSFTMRPLKVALEPTYRPAPQPQIELGPTLATALK